MSIRNIGSLPIHIFPLRKPFIPLRKPESRYNRFSRITEYFEKHRAKEKTNADSVLSLPYRYRRTQYKSFSAATVFGKDFYKPPKISPYPPDFGLFFFCMQKNLKGVVKYERN